MPVARSRGRNLDYILAERRARRQSRLRALLFAVLGAGAFYVVLHTFLEQRATPALEPNRLVVVPFENRTGDAAFDTLGLVAADRITRVLGRFTQAREVVPTTTALAYMHSARLARHDLYNRAMQLGRGTRSQFVVWGTFYRVGDTLRFNVEMQDLKTSLMVGSFPQISAHVRDAAAAVDRLRRVVVREVFAGEMFNQRPIASLSAYQPFVSGLDHYVNRRYAAAARDFATARAHDSVSTLPHQVWLLQALLEARRFPEAAIAAQQLRGSLVPRSEEARAMRALARLKNDRGQAHSWASALAQQNGADDLAHYEYALEALANRAPRAALLAFGELLPHIGLLHGRPDVFLHHAAAYHLLANHQGELRVVRAGIMLRHRSLDVRLANCRVRAALGNHQNAIAALSAIAARDTDTTSALTVGQALADCAAELDAHGLIDAAGRAEQLARDWHARRPAPAPLVRDEVYERVYLQLDRARAEAEQGNGGPALNLLYDALGDGLPYYEPGRMMLHAEPAFRRLRNTRGFLRINQTNG